MVKMVSFMLYIFYHNKKIAKETEEFYSMIQRFDLINTYGILQAITAEYTFIVSPHETSTKIGLFLDRNATQTNGKEMKSFQISYLM